MENRLSFKYGVSDWMFYFPNDVQYKLNTIQEETVTTICDGKTIITLTNASVPKKLLDLFRKKKDIVWLEQEVYLKNNEDDTTEIIKYCYSNIKIKSFTINSKRRDIGNVTISVEGD